MRRKLMIAIIVALSLGCAGTVIEFRAQSQPVQHEAAYWGDGAWGS